MNDEYVTEELHVACDPAIFTNDLDGHLSQNRLVAVVYLICSLEVLQFCANYIFIKLHHQFLKLKFSVQHPIIID